METFKNAVTGDINAIEGSSVDGRGVVGTSQTDYGIRAHSVRLSGLRGSSDEGCGVEGWAIKADGVAGVSKEGHGIRGTAEGGGVGVVGVGNGGNGGWFESVSGEGVRGWSKNLDHGGLVGVNSAKGIAIYGISEEGVGVHAKGGYRAGYFDGQVEVAGSVTVSQDISVKGDIRLTNADCAEDFDIAGPQQVQPGTVMVLGEEGALLESRLPYDKRVAGVISGAGDFQPGIVLDRQEATGNRQPVALMGKVFCKVDARFGAIEVGDLLTTSETPGHAMRAGEPLQAFGSVIGKALRPWREGQGLIPILIALQ